MHSSFKILVKQFNQTLKQTCESQYTKQKQSKKSAIMENLDLRDLFTGLALPLLLPFQVD